MHQLQQQQEGARGALCIACCWQGLVASFEQDVQMCDL
jgi:hypothetical protein